MTDYQPEFWDFERIQRWYETHRCNPQCECNPNHIKTNQEALQ